MAAEILKFLRVAEAYELSAIFFNVLTVVLYDVYGRLGRVAQSFEGERLKALVQRRWRTFVVDKEIVADSALEGFAPRHRSCICGFAAVTGTIV